MLPGIYKFIDAGDNIIYIGKAKNLKKRLSQYNLELSNKNQKMVSVSTRIEYIVTDSESSALLLEGQLIKKFRPKFNILLKDDKSFPYIKFRLDHEYPQLIKFRGKNLNEGKFFGPFASAAHVDTTLSELQKIFRLRSCTDSFFANRTRPCLQYQIKRCCAPCVQKVSKAEYDDLVKEVKAFLEGKNQLLQTMLSAKMEMLSHKMEYEKAALIRDRIKAISYVQLKSQNAHNLQDADVLAVASSKGMFCIQLFLYRSSQPCGNQAYFLDGDEDSVAELLGCFLMQLYQVKTPPKQILLSHALEDKNLYIEALYKLHNVRVNIMTPKFGGKSKVLGNALYNAEIALDKHMKISVKNHQVLQEVQEIFALNSLPTRIELYDNSHIQGAFPVGAMVVAGLNGFEKPEYRLFNFNNLSLTNNLGGDDYAMLTNVLQRRLKRLLAEPEKKPDLMIIDGGKGHLNTVNKIMKNFNMTIPFVCMSKGKDRNSGQEYFHQVGRDSFTIDKNRQVMKYLQILRDEVHNFAITSHRRKRSKAIKVSSLDQIQGIGQVRKRALLNYFGSFASIADATRQELEQVEGINTSMAEIIYTNLKAHHN